MAGLLYLSKVCTSSVTLFTAAKADEICTPQFCLDCYCYTHFPNQSLTEVTALMNSYGDMKAELMDITDQTERATLLHLDYLLRGENSNYVWIKMRNHSSM